MQNEKCVQIELQYSKSGVCGAEDGLKLIWPVMMRYERRTGKSVRMLQTMSKRQRYERGKPLFPSVTRNERHTYRKKKKSRYNIRTASTAGESENNAKFLHRNPPKCGEIAAADKEAS